MTIPLWYSKLPSNLIVQKAKAAEIDPNILAAICYVESSAFVYAVRYEPNYRWLWHPEKYAKRLNISADTERNLQKQSYGLGQIMGATSRWMGFTGPLGTLYKPENNLYWVSQFIKYLHKKYDGDYERVVSAYNRGTQHPQKDENGKYFNQSYVDKVFKLYEEINA